MTDQKPNDKKRESFPEPKKGRSGKSFVAGAVTGVLLGAVTTLLVAPKSGKQLRKDISEHARNAAEKTQMFTESLGKKTQEIANSVGQKTQKITSNVGNAARDWAVIAKEAFNHARNEARSLKEARKEIPAVDGGMEDTAKVAAIENPPAETLPQSAEDQEAAGTYR